MTTHTFKLNGSNTSSNSNLHTTFSQSPSAPLSSHSGSNVQSLSNSNSSIVTSVMRDRTNSLNDPTRPRSGSTASDVSPDSPNAGDINDDGDNPADVDVKEQYLHEEQLDDKHNDFKSFGRLSSYPSAGSAIEQVKCTRGINLAFLLPFIGNIFYLM